MEVSESVSKEAYFGKSKEIKPMYRFIRVPPNITDTYTITSAGTTTPATIDIPVDTYNHYKSCLQWDMTIAGGTNQKNYMFTSNPCCIQKLEFYSRNGQVKVIDANQLNDAYEVMWKSGFSDEDFQTFPRMNHRLAAYDQSQGFFLQPNRCGYVSNNITAVLTNNNRTSTFLTAGGNNVQDINGAVTNGVADINIVHPDAVYPQNKYGGGSDVLTPYTGINDIPLLYKEFQYTIIQKNATYKAVASGDSDNGPAVRVSLPLGRLIHSFFAKNKDIHYGDIFTIRITWGASKDVYCTNAIANAQATRLTTTTAALSSVPYPANGTPTSGGGSVTISNLRFEACQESNPIISNALRSQYFAEGQHIIYDHYSFFRQSAGTATSQSPQIRLSVGDGQRVKYLYWAPYSSSLATNLRYDHYNVNDAKLLSFYTSLNSARMQNNDIDTSNEDDFHYLRPLIQDSPLMLDSLVYKRNWFWCESFVGNNEPLWKQIKDDADKMQPEGKSLNVSDFLYSVNATMKTATSYQWTFVAVCQKEVIISAKGTIVV